MNSTSHYFYAFWLLLILFISCGLNLRAQNSNYRPDSVKVAAVQVSGYDKVTVPGFYTDAPGKAVEYIDRAANEGAQLVVFPEYYLGRISVPGKETQQISDAAAKNHIYVVIGSWEVFTDGRFANAALLFDREGEIAGKYYKTHAAVDTYEGEPAFKYPPKDKSEEWFLENDPEWIMVKGQEFPVFNLDFGKIGILTCYDGWFPEPCRILSLKGAEILVWINGRYGCIEENFVRTFMWHNTVSMIGTNLAYGYGTMIAQWPGNILKVCSQPGEDFIVATLDLKSLRLARENSRNNQQRRPDIYQEILMECPR